jgi:hypothetical protein
MSQIRPVEHTVPQSIVRDNNPNRPRVLGLLSDGGTLPESTRRYFGVRHGVARVSQPHKGVRQGCNRARGTERRSTSPLAYTMVTGRILSTVILPRCWTRHPAEHVGVPKIPQTSILISRVMGRHMALDGNRVELLRLGRVSSGSLSSMYICTPLHPSR